MIFHTLFGQIFAQPADQTYLINGDKYYEEGNYDMAINSYVVYKLSNPKDKEINFDIGKCYYKKAEKEVPSNSIIGIPPLTTNAENAITYFKYYLDSQPPISINSDEKVYIVNNWIVETYAIMLNWEKALEYVKIIYEANPNYKFPKGLGIKEYYNDANNALANWYCDQASLYSEKKNEIEEKKHYQKALQYFIEPLSEHSLFYRGFANSKLGNVDKAKIDFENVIKLYPNGLYTIIAKQQLETININATLKSDPVNSDLLTFERPSYKGETLYYKGQVKNGMANGEGEVTTSTNQYYKGGFKDNEYHGKGLHRWSNGDTYEGDWINGQRTGKGLYKWINGQYYDGDFVNGSIAIGSGTGYFYYDNGTYKGSILNNNRHGKGTYRWTNGDIYVGDWQNGNRTGNGKLILANGTVQEGIFENNVYKGNANVTKPIDTFNEEQEVEKAKLAVKEKRYKDAIGNYTYIINKTGQAFAFYERGKIYATLKDYQKAKDDFNAAINIWSTMQTEKYSWLKEDAQKELKKIENK